MIHSPDLTEFIVGWENVRTHAYPDGEGVMTIGIGHTKGVKLGDTCTVEQAHEWLHEDLFSHAKDLTPYFQRQPSQRQYDALLSLAFNAGAIRIGESGVMARFNAGLDQECADRFRLWNKDEGKVVKGLVKRREAERAIYLWSDYSGRP